MTLAAKIGLAGLGAAVLGGSITTGCYLAGSFDYDQAESWIPWISLKEETSNTNTNTDYDSKIGKLYGKYLVGSNTDTNKRWWENIFKTKYEVDKKNEDTKSKLSTDFSSEKVTLGYSTDNSKALNKVCDAIYKKEEGAVSFDAITTSPDANEAKKKLGRDLLKYCSILGQKPEKIQDNEGYGDGTIGNTNKNDLASTKSEANNDFWQAQNRWFKSLGNSAPTDSFFSKFFEGEGDSKFLKDDHSIKSICEEAYKATATTGTATETQPKTDDVKKYCSFKREA